MSLKTDPSNMVFISYRRSTSSFIARSIFMDLHQNGYDAFLDVETIDSGHFDSIILNQIAARMHFVLILTPGALERCAEPGDWLRREIETAIDLKRNIVPVLVEGFSFDKEKEHLSGKLEELPRFNSLKVYHEYFEAAMEDLRTRRLKPPEYEVRIQPTSASDQAVVQHKIEQVLSAAPPSNDEMQAETFFENGHRKWTTGDFEGAVADCTEAIRLRPDFVEAYSRRGTAYASLGNFKAAEADFNEAIRLNPNFVFAYMNRGMGRGTTGDQQGAIADFTKAIELNPKFSQAYVSRGYGRSLMGDIDGAISDYTMAIHIDPDSAPGYFNRAIAYGMKQNHDNAILDLDEVIRITPNYSSAYFNRAIARHFKGDLDGSIADASEAIRLTPIFADAFVVRGNSYSAKGLWDNAIADFEAALHINPQHVMARQNLDLAQKQKRGWRPW